MYSSLRQALTLSALSSVVFGVTLIGNVPFAVPGFLGINTAYAQQLSPSQRQYFLSDPLSQKPRDPLLPMPSVDRPLSPLELSAVEDSLDELNQSAQENLAIGNDDEAFALWLRELRLRRVFGPVAEFQAIRRVAGPAWNQQRSVEVQLLTLRTREIWQTVQAALNQDLPDDRSPATPAALGEESPDVLADKPEQVLVSGGVESDVAVLAAIAQTFSTLRDIDSAVEVYQQLIQLTLAQGGDPTAQQQELAELHLRWFQFADAADVYLALLKDAKDQGNQIQETAYLEQLTYSYQQADSLVNAVRAQTDLIALYQAQGQVEKLPELLLAIAQNYRILNQHRSAIEYYRAAYSAAQRFEQFSFSAQVLQDLGTLYRSLALTDEALGAYSLLVPVEQQAYNAYGVMNAYDSMGQIYRRQGNSLEALKAFEKALVIANQLSLREDYFIEQIESVTPNR
ncbi:MAG: tetratricopeptide repeat protein [Phormidesmis sp.]